MATKKPTGRPARKTDNKDIRLALLSKSIPVNIAVGALKAADPASLFGVHVGPRAGLKGLLKLLMSLDVISTQSVQEFTDHQFSERLCREAARKASKASEMLRVHLS